MDHHCENGHTVKRNGEVLLELECDMSMGHQVKVHRQQLQNQKTAFWWLDGVTESELQ